MQPVGRRGAASLGRVGARQRADLADLAELAEWVEGLRAAAAKARQDGNIALAEALDVTRFEVYEGYLDEELDQKGHAVHGQEAHKINRFG
jgi:hypothetical protein